MEIKDRIRVKLVMYCLLEIRTFVLHQYDPELTEQITNKIGNRDRHRMLLFTLRTLLPFKESISKSIDDILEDLVTDARHVNDSRELFIFAEERIPSYVNRLRYMI